MKNRVLFAWINRYGFGFKPPSISYLSAIAKKRGFEISLWDTSGIDFSFNTGEKNQEEILIFKPVDWSKYNVERNKINMEKSFIKHFEDFKPDYLALSVLNDERFLSSRISKVAKEIEPSIRVIWGGKYPTINPGKVLEDYCVDYVNVGEGIESFPELLCALMEGKDLSRIKNIWGKQDGVVFKNSIRPQKKDLDELPFLDWSIFDKRHFYKPYDGEVVIGADYMANWGCPYRCTYCINNFNQELYDNKYKMRKFSVERTIKELGYLKEKHGLTFIKFHDEDFLMRNKNDFALWSRRYKESIGLPFTIETNPLSVTEEKAYLLKEMNCVSVSIAIETGNQYLRKNVLKRPDSRQDIIHAFSLLKANNIRANAFNLLGFPFETRETYEDTVEMNRIADVQIPNMSYFFPYEGTELYDISIKQGNFTWQLILYQSTIGDSEKYNTTMIGEVNIAPVKPNKKSNIHIMTVAGVAGLIISLCLVFFIEYIEESKARRKGKW